jgi:hypothetical protein
MIQLFPRFFLDLGCVEQRRHDRRRANADRDASLDELGAALLVRFVEIVAIVAHRTLLVVALSMTQRARLEAA